MLDNDFDEKYTLAITLAQHGELGAAQKLANELLMIAQENSDASKEGLALLALGNCALYANKPRRALSHLTEAANFLRATQLWAQFGEAKVLLSLIELKRSNRAVGVQHLIEALKLINANSPGNPVLATLTQILEPALLDAKSGDGTMPNWSEAIIELADANLMLGHALDALRLAERSLEGQLDETQLLHAKKVAGVAAGMVGVLEKAIGHLKDAEAIAKRTLGYEKVPLDILHNLGKTYKNSGAYSDAIAVLERAATLARTTQVRDPFFDASNLIEIGSVYHEMGDPRTARQYLQEARTLTERMPIDEDPQSAALHACAITNLGLIECDERDYNRAIQLQMKALSVLDRETFSAPTVMAQVQANLGLALMFARRFGDAAEHWERALALYRQLGNLARETVATTNIGRARYLQGNYPLAVEKLEEALEKAKAASGQEYYGEVLFYLACARASLSGLANASSLFEDVAKIFKTLDKPNSLAHILSVWADFCVREGSFVAAESLRRQAVDQWKRTGIQNFADLEEVKWMEVCLTSGHEKPCGFSIDALDRLAQNADYAAYALYVRAILQHADTRTAKAIVTIEQALRLLQVDDEKEFMAVVLLTKGEILSSSGDRQGSVNSVQSALVYIDIVPDRSFRAELWARAARFFLVEQKDPLEAVMCLEHVAENYLRADELEKAANAHMEAAIVLEEEESWAEVERHLAKSANLFERLGQTENRLRCEWQEGRALFNQGRVGAARQKLTHVALACLAADAMHIAAEAIIDLVDFSVQIDDLSQAECALLLVPPETRKKNKATDERWSIASALVWSEKAHRDAMIDPHEFRRLYSSSLPDYLWREILDKLRAQDYGAVRDRLLTALHGEKQHPEIGPLSASEAQYTAKLWHQGLSRMRGWRHSSLQQSSFPSAPHHFIPADTRSADSEHTSVRKMVSIYHELEVWEDPNLAVFLPIIETYSQETRFENRVNINPLAVSQDCLDFFFFRSDPRGMLAKCLDTCMYISTGNLVLCSLPFLERVSKLVELTTDELMNPELYEWNDRILQDIGLSKEQLCKLVVPAFTAQTGNAILQWIIAHEIGHAEMRHEVPFDSPVPRRRDLEEEADRFFVKRIPNETEAAKIMLTLVSNLVAKLFGEIFEEQHGNDCAGFGMDSRRITVRDTGGPHAPLLLRVLDLADRILEAFPKVDQTGHYARVRANITVTEVRND